MPDVDARVELPPLALAVTDETMYCMAARRARCNEIWWYFNGLRRVPGFSKPFRCRNGRWWYQVKRGFAWPLDFFKPNAAMAMGLSSLCLLGWMYPVINSLANSRVQLNIIDGLGGYDLRRVASAKRRAVRKGVKHLMFDVACPASDDVTAEACEIWNSHVERTGWNTAMSLARFRETWGELAHWPGTTVLVARDPARNNMMCAWLIARVIDGTVYIDTIASHTDRLENRPNDSLIYVCLALAERQGVQRAHYSLRSNLPSLEAFKASLGFESRTFPTRLVLRWPVGPLLRTFRPAIYRRLVGYDEIESHRALVAGSQNGNGHSSANGQLGGNCHLTGNGHLSGTGSLET